MAHALILWVAALFVLVLVAGAVRRGGWLPRATVALSAASLLGFGLSDPDGRIADRNVARFERNGHIDLPYLATLSPDAAPALVRLPPGRAACVTRRMRRQLARGDGLLGANLGRAKARRALAFQPRCGAPA